MFNRLSWLVAAVLACTAAAHAQPQPVARHPYEITADAGPWCIYITCFFDNIDQRGYTTREIELMKDRSKSRRLAIDFVSELRGDRYKLPAYMHYRGDEDLMHEEERVAKERKELEQLYITLGKDPRDIPVKKYVKRYAHVQIQYAVLLGGFPDQESARRALKDIREKEPPKVKNKDGHLVWEVNWCEKYLSKLVAGVGGTTGKADGHGMYVNPFKSAMVVPNPTGPKVKAPTADPEELARGLAALNADNKYNLLKHAGKWSLVVKVYRTPVTVKGLDPKDEVRKVSANSDKIFEANVKQAEQLAALLRHPQLNFDAYVLHTPASSMVTVGVFESDKDPRMPALQAQLSKLRLDPEQLMSPPLPIPVPRGK